MEGKREWNSLKEFAFLNSGGLDKIQNNSEDRGFAIGMNYLRANFQFIKLMGLSLGTYSDRGGGTQEGAQ